MKLSKVAAWCCLPLVMASPAAIKAEGETKKEGKKAESQLPEHLTEATFDQYTSEHLTFVEFFSPLCLHCRQLAPKWEKAFLDSKEEQESLQIHMRQVNCQADGDLCAREDILFYPNLRLYSPERDADGKKTGKLKFIDSYPRALTQTPENIVKYIKNLAAEYNNDVDMPSSSIPLNVDSTMNVVAGEIEEPFFMMIFPGSEDQWKSGKFLRGCKDCLEHKQKWDKLSNLILSASKSGHLACKTHPTLCEKLGYPELSSDILQIPRVAMFLPKATGLIRFDYTGEFTVAAMKQYVTKLAANAQYEKVTMRDLEDTGAFTVELPEKPIDLYYPLNNRVSLVFLYDKKKVTKEDKAIMPHLLELVTKLPFNINLFASESVKFEKAMEEQAHGLVGFANSESSFAKREFNNPMHLATTLTAKPTLLLFKENSLIPAVYQNFALEDMRDMDKIEKFIRNNMHPLYEALTPEMMKHYFNANKKKSKKSKKNDKNDKVVVTFVEMTNAKKLNEAMYNMSVVAHQYNLLKKEYYFKDLLEKRDEKGERVAKLKAHNADTVLVIQEMRQEIPHMFDHDDVVFTFVDIVEYPKFADENGWNINGRGYRAGDSIVVSKDNQFYWDLNLSGANLTSEPSKLRPVLEYLLDSTLVGDAKVAGFSLKLTGSPYHRYFRLFDVLHVHGLLGYFMFVSVVVFLYIALKMLRRRRWSQSKSRRGIIGNLAKKD